LKEKKGSLQSQKNYFSW